MITEEIENKDCYLDKSKKIDKFIPEKDIKFINFDKILWNKKFWLKPKNNFNKLQLTNIGIYSIAIKDICMAIPKIIKKYIPDKDIIITETTGGLGGLSICLINSCKLLNIVEITPIHSKVIENNLSIYNFDKNKYKIINDDYMNVMLELEQDVIVADVPWGGYAYKFEENINLGLNNVNIVCIINLLLKYKKFKLFILLIPYNFDINYFSKHIKGKFIKERIEKSKHYLITVFS